MWLFVAVVASFFCRRLRPLTFVLLGFLAFMQAGAGVVGSRLDPRYAGDSLLTQVRVVDFPRRSGASTTLVIEPLADERLPPRSRVTWFEAPEQPAIGDIWQFELRLRAPRGNSNPGVFSLDNWMFREKLQATGYVVPGQRNRRLGGGDLTAIDTLRADFVARAGRVEGAAGAVIAAIGVGARHRVSRTDWDRYAATGTSHLMAISGLHIGLAAAAAFAVAALLSGLLRLPGNHLDRATVAGLGVAVAYAGISGLLVPSQRATMMLGLAALAMLVRRRVDALHTLALTAALLYLLDPLAILTPGFSLSFTAVAVLLWFARHYRRTPGGQRPLARAAVFVRQLAAMQVALLLGLMPLTSIIFHRVAFTAPVANLLSVPVFSVVTVPLVLASFPAHALSATAGATLLTLAAASIGFVDAVTAWLAAFPGAYRSIAGMGGAASGIYCVVLLPALWVLLPRGWPGRWLAIVAVGALVLHRPAAPGRDCVDAHVLDVGQGLAVVLQSRRHALVFDTGASFRGGGSAAEQVLLPFLEYKGIGRLDWLVVSHADNDHAGGVAALLGRIDVGPVYLGEPLELIADRAAGCQSGQVWSADGVEYRMLHPVATGAADGNNASCVLSVRVGAHSLLLTGDIERAAEERLLGAGLLQAASVVVIPHHGSLTSSSPAFVSAVRPTLAIASAGYANRWGFPKPQVMARWQNAGAAVLDTASSGAVSIRLCARDGIRGVRQERDRGWRFWHDPKPG